MTRSQMSTRPTEYGSFFLWTINFGEHFSLKAALFPTKKLDCMMVSCKGSHKLWLQYVWL